MGGPVAGGIMSDVVEGIEEESVSVPTLDAVKL